MTLPRTITTLLLSLLCLASACGGTETDVSDEPVDVTDPVEQTDEALRPGGTVGFSSCSAPPVTCRNAKGQITGQADGCSMLCFNQTAMCWAGTCQGRIIINASCGCFGL
jgi:hypothetical protein